MEKKKVLIGAFIIGVMIIASFGVINIAMYKSKLTYTVLFLDEYDQVIQKAYRVKRPLKWTEADEFKTEEYEEALFINKCVVPTRIKLVLAYRELFANQGMYFLIFMILCGIYFFLSTYRPTSKKENITLVKIVGPVDVINDKT